MKVRIMTWTYRLVSIFRFLSALLLRKIAKNRTEDVLRRLDDRTLDDIGIIRSRIPEYARKAAHNAVPLPVITASGFKSRSDSRRLPVRPGSAVRNKAAHEFSAPLPEMGARSRPGEVDRQRSGKHEKAEATI